MKYVWKGTVGVVMRASLGAVVWQATDLEEISGCVLLVISQVKTMLGVLSRSLGVVQSKSTDMATVSVDNHMTIHSKGTGEGVDLAYLNKFRKCISNKRGVLKLDVPLMWFLLELVTRRIEKKFFKEDEQKHFCLKNGYIDSHKADDQFFCLLKLLHMLGFYVYFDLDPRYLRGSVNYVCTDATALYREVSKLLAVQYTPAPLGTTEEFKTTGIIHHPYDNLLSELGIIIYI